MIDKVGVNRSDNTARARSPEPAHSKFAKRFNFHKLTGFYRNETKTTNAQKKAGLQRVFAEAGAKIRLRASERRQEKLQTAEQKNEMRQAATKADNFSITPEDVRKVQKVSKDLTDLASEMRSAGIRASRNKGQIPQSMHTRIEAGLELKKRLLPAFNAMEQGDSKVRSTAPGWEKSKPYMLMKEAMAKFDESVRDFRAITQSIEERELEADLSQVETSETLSNQTAKHGHSISFLTNASSGVEPFSPTSLNSPTQGNVFAWDQMSSVSSERTLDGMQRESSAHNMSDLGPAEDEMSFLDAFEAEDAASVIRSDPQLFQATNSDPSSKNVDDIVSRLRNLEGSIATKPGGVR